ncbi:MAG: GDP-mannose 4,6-dehydratase [Actinobacteria bacterium]|nr:GDP-mannose 4,6-dehydratase [Actinomycetota bacterium]MCL6105297.1 GDP-mannose 4,6-dehydratase [Actinomycetota bacterium]
MRAVVTGGAGFIGSSLVDRLLAEGWKVDVVDDLSTGSLANLADARTIGRRSLSFHNLDITLSQSEELIKKIKPDVIFHLAAQSSVRPSLDNPVYDAQVNILGTLRILEGARLAKVERVVYAASGGTLYGEVASSKLPLDESAPIAPMSPYGVSKKVGLDYLRLYREIYGIEFCALALANVYGPRQNPHGEAGVVAIFAEKLCKKQQCVIYGDGEQTRDFVYIDDVVDAFVRASEQGGGLLLNIGTGIRVSINDLYQIMAKACGLTPILEAIHLPPKAGELRDNSLDPTRALVHLGWKQWTSLKDGVEEVIKSAKQVV